MIPRVFGDLYGASNIWSFATRSDINLSGDCNLTSSCIFIIYEHHDRSSHDANSAYFEKVKVETGEDDGVEKIKIPEPTSAGHLQINGKTNIYF